MKRLNKKGFTLAELLIVIAIIAILIAIAIPAFSASLYSANLQTDHANIREAYAMARTADMLGSIDSGTGDAKPVNAGTDYYFQVDGTISEGSGAKNYELKATSKSSTDCETSLSCTWSGTTTNHTKGNYIIIRSDAEKKCKVVLEKPTAPGP